jgi:hypothetical protein
MDTDMDKDTDTDTPIKKHRFSKHFFLFRKIFYKIKKKIFILI